MDIKHTYHLTIEWTGNRGQGTVDYKGYERSHSIRVAGKPDIQGSSDPAFRGDKTKHNPEELFVSTIASCHMLWYLHLCADASIVVTAYTDEAEGIMQETANNSGQFTEVTLHPNVVVKERAMIEKALALHHKAHKQCFIANSCNFPIYNKPLCTSEND